MEEPVLPPRLLVPAEQDPVTPAEERRGADAGRAVSVEEGSHGRERRPEVFIRQDIERFLDAAHDQQGRRYRNLQHSREAMNAANASGLSPVVPSVVRPRRLTATSCHAPS